MKIVIIDDTVILSEVPESTPIFAKSDDGKLCGMVVHEKADGWIIKIGGPNGCSGHHETRLIAMREGMRYGYTYFVESE